VAGHPQDRSGHGADPRCRRCQTTTLLGFHRRRTRAAEPRTSRRANPPRPCRSAQGLARYGRAADFRPHRRLRLAPAAHRPARRATAIPHHRLGQCQPSGRHRRRAHRRRAESAAPEHQRAAAAHRRRIRRRRAHDRRRIRRLRLRTHPAHPSPPCRRARHEPQRLVRRTRPRLLVGTALAQTGQPPAA